MPAIKIQGTIQRAIVDGRAFIDLESGEYLAIGTALPFAASAALGLHFSSHTNRRDPGPGDVRRRVGNRDACVEDMTAQDVNSAMWHDRTLVKTWAMRGALHLITADEMPLYAAARSLHPYRSWPQYFAYDDISPVVHAKYLDLAPDILWGGPLSREQFAAAVNEQISSPELHRMLLDKSWGRR